MSLKERIGELISNIAGCTTCDGVKEMEAMYSGKKKEMGDEITPMMDIMVRDAIAGRRTEIETAEAEAAEKKAEAEQKKKDAKAIKKMDEYKDVKMTTYEDFLAESAGGDVSIHKAVFTFARMNPPTIAHAQLMEQMAVVAESTGSMPMVYLSHTQDEKRNPLSYDQKRYFVESIAPETVQVVESDVRNLFDLLEHLSNKGFTELYAVVGNDRIDEFQRAGRYFLNHVNGHSFTVVNSGDREVSDISSTNLRDLVEVGDFPCFWSKSTHLELDAATSLYESVEAGMGL